MKKINETSLLIHVKISTWTGRRKDKTATIAVEKEFKANKGAGNYTKKLLPDSKELASVVKIEGKIREYFHSQSLPWLNDGARILKADNYINFCNHFRKMKSYYDQAVSEFIAQYPILQASAQATLGELYNAAEYPSANKLRDSFECDFTAFPLPDASDFRIDLGDLEKAELTKKIQNVQVTAMRDCWQRLYDVVNSAADRLAQPGAQFRESLLSNVTELCALLPSLNITDDPTLEQKRLEVETAIAELDAETLRQNPIERENAAAKLNEIMGTMGAFMGQAPDPTSKIVAARLNGAQFEGMPGANLGNGIIIKTGSDQ